MRQLRPPEARARVPPAEGGYGGGDSGSCVMYGCACRRFAPSDEFEEQRYSGDAMPKWVAEGAKVKVKCLYKGFSMSAHGALRGANDNYVHPGEVGTIERVDGAGTWSWNVDFGRGRTVGLSERALETLARVTVKRAAKHRFEGDAG
jgi:hypothetical protein